MKASVILALLGFTSAASLKQCLPECPPAPPACAPQSLCNLSINSAGGAAGGAKYATLGPASRAGSYAALASESAGSSTNIAAQQIVIPDRQTVTDQTKVSESCERGSDQAQSCEVASRTFEIGGSITVKEKYNDSSKGEFSSQKEGEGASQSRSRSQVANNLCAKATIPCTCSSPCPPPAPVCGC